MISKAKKNVSLGLFLTFLCFISLYGQKAETIRSNYLEGNYYFRNIQTGQYLFSEPNGAVRMDQMDFQDNSTWNLKSESNGYYSITSSVANRGYIATGQNDTSITQELGTLNENKEWQIIQIDSTTYRFLSKNPSSGFITATATDIRSSENGENPASQWQLINTKKFEFENQYYLKNTATGKFLDSHESDALVAIHPVKRADNSIWQFITTPDGHIIIDNVLSDRGPVRAFDAAGQQVRYEEVNAITNPTSQIKWKILYLHDNKLQFLNENTNVGYLTTLGTGLVRTDHNYNPKEASWELIPADQIEFDEPYYLKNIKTGQYLYAGEDLSVQQQKSIIDEGSLWSIKKASDGFYTFDNSKTTIGPLMAMPTHTAMKTMDESLNASTDIGQEWQVIRLSENRYSFLSKDFNRGFITATDSDGIQNLPNGTDTGAQWELVKKSENPVIDTGVVIYPNPATDNFTINFGKETIQNVLIYTITGRLIYEKALTQNQSELSITQKLRTGTYMIQLINDQGTAITRRLIMI